MFHNTSTDSLRTVKWLLTPKECVFSKKKKESNFTFAQWICDSVLKTCVWAKHASSSLQAQQSSGGQGRKIPWTQSRLGLHSEFQTSLDDIQCVALAQKAKQANRKKSCIFLAAEAGDLETTFPVLNTPHSFPHCRSLALFMLCYVMWELYRSAFNFPPHLHEVRVSGIFSQFSISQTFCFHVQFL